MSAQHTNFDSSKRTRWF